MTPRATASHQAPHRATRVQASVLPAWPGTAPETARPAPTPGDVLGEMGMVVAVLLTLAFAATAVLNAFGL